MGAVAAGCGVAAGTAFFDGASARLAGRNMLTTPISATTAITPNADAGTSGWRLRRRLRTAAVRTGPMRGSPYSAMVSGDGGLAALVPATGPSTAPTAGTAPSD